MIDSVIFDEDTCAIDGQVGACAAGETTCSPIFADDGKTIIDGTPTCAQIVYPGDRDEVCNGIDDNCNGVRDDFVDDDGNYEVPGLGVSCATQVDSCPNGATSCDASSGEVVCLSGGDNPTDGDETLVCDGIDNNCDGTTDEPFKDENGIYDRLNHCGSCDINCDKLWDGRPDDFNVVPFCDVNENFALCGFACADGYVDVDGLEDNGCELKPDTQAIYVTRPARGGVDSAECGPYSAPCATINFAINKADGDDSKTRVRVAEGSYAESFDLKNGISVLGGHNAKNFTQNADANITTLTGATTEATLLFVVRASGITENTELSGFAIRAPAARDGKSSVGLIVSTSTSALTISQNRILSGAGGSGVRGAVGDNGLNGSNGKPGNESNNEESPCPTSDVLGGLGAAGECPNLRTGGTVDVHGGDGALGQRCPVFGEASPPGESGAGVTLPGNGGLSAHHWSSYYYNGGWDWQCFQPTEGDELPDGEELVRSPERGGPGPAGDDGDSGSGGSNTTGSFNGVSWIGDAGSDGQHGLPGAGGGGSGAAAGVDEPPEEVNWEEWVYVGASGGGGGSGGCAGHGGGSGGAGGGSFAVILNATDDANDVPQFSQNSFIRGHGGAGGSGGSAGSGGDGGSGGEPGRGVHNDGSAFDFCMTDADYGGVGGRGGHGGGGGGGAGGASFDVLVVSSTPDSTASAAGVLVNNSFPVDAGSNSGGAGGTGGSSQENPGDDGATGASGRLLKLQP